jgi:hypothetical protein
MKGLNAAARHHQHLRGPIRLMAKDCDRLRNIPAIRCGARKCFMTAGRSSRHRRFHFAIAIRFPDLRRADNERPPPNHGGRSSGCGACRGDLLPEIAQELKSDIWIRVSTYEVDAGNDVVRRSAERFAHRNADRTESIGRYPCLEALDRLFESVVVRSGGVAPRGCWRLSGKNGQERCECSEYDFGGHVQFSCSESSACDGHKTVIAAG